MTSRERSQILRDFLSEENRFWQRAWTILFLIVFTGLGLALMHRMPTPSTFDGPAPESWTPLGPAPDDEAESVDDPFGGNVCQSARQVQSQRERDDPLLRPAASICGPAGQTFNPH